MSIVVETPRLVLRRLEESDAEFILTLVNDPAWLEFIGRVIFFSPPFFSKSATQVS